MSATIPAFRTVPRLRRVRGRVPAPLLACALAAAGAVLAASPSLLGAQEPEPEVRDCRCVGPDGEELEGCVCFQAPRVSVTGLDWPTPRRARIGVALAGDRDGRGARVERVLEDGPADEAGIREGDVILSLGGTSLLEPLPDEGDERRVDPDGPVLVQRLVALVADLEPGEPVEVEYERDGRRERVTLVPEENPGFVAIGGDGEGGWAFRMVPDGMRGMADRLRRLGEGLEDFDGEGLRIRSPRRGFSGFVFPGGLARCPGSEAAHFSLGTDCVAGARLIEVNPELGAYFGTERGVLVSEADDDSPLGLRAGDVLLAIDGREVDAPDDVARILRSYEDGEEVTLRVMRGQRQTEVRGRVG